jgi:hypothetical protein
MASAADQLELLVKIVVGIIVFCSIALILPFNKMTLVANPTNEGFSDAGYPTSQLCKMPLTTPEPRKYGPADSTLKNPREPYHLLGDYIKPAEERIANLTSECAYIADGQRLIEKTGSYGQVTNNYKHKTPDNGTTWLHELSVSFYG